MSTPPQTIHYRFDDVIYACSRTDVGLNELVSSAGSRRSSRGDYFSVAADHAVDNGFANAPGSTSNEYSFAFELAGLACLRFILHGS
jgi:hypothetical protein